MPELDDDRSAIRRDACLEAHAAVAVSFCGNHASGFLDASRVVVVVHLAIDHDLASIYVDNIALPERANLPARGCFDVRRIEVVSLPDHVSSVDISLRASVASP